MEKSVKSIATNYGLYLGVLLALFTVLAYAISLELLTEMWYGIVILIVIVAFGIVSVAKIKQAQDSYASFKEAFTAYFITVLIGLVISTFVSFLLFNVIDTDAAALLKEMTIEKTIQMMEGFNTPSEAIAQAVENIENQDQFGLLSIVKGLAGYLVFFSIIGLIVAAAMKKSKPDTE
ncbi:uncharacterized protein DUF4199 [Mariniflexile fucanivorans]|uniref:Uncharacterized protein DUF4199 n=1 Tax=Mariniflexile fucanivorans TaxID=264023 RepID=A0A4R1RF04_9FLAO|nr:DUF4199 domain-containing protein [Mariniflexile fucanivorans]TCL64449.1 uncharacterized protein DUF4199 [Mariniflexile fucanivorans]